MLRYHLLQPHLVAARQRVAGQPHDSALRRDRKRRRRDGRNRGGSVDADTGLHGQAPRRADDEGGGTQRFVQRLFQGQA